jgi:23S rRNA (cytidine1920-2'-O)/16S rRNA (cytidine1409-2'-O)-methyltransferase
MRADLYLSQNGYAQSRQRARLLIEEGCVQIDGEAVKKPSQEISEEVHTVEVREVLPYVGRGGLKLEAALDAFSLDVRDALCLDVGASTGGFTDCLLKRGARFVTAVDSGSDQLAPALREDPRVCSLERKNARELTLAEIGEPVDLIVMDVSFISATYLIPSFPAWMKPEASAVILIKPQFEVGRSMLGKGGIVKDPKAHRMAVERVLESAAACGLIPVGLIPSPIKGGDGNREFLVCMTQDREGILPLRAEQIRAICDIKK